MNPPTMNPPSNHPNPVQLDHWLQFLAGVGPRRMRISTVEVLLRLATGETICGRCLVESEMRQVLKHYATHITRARGDRQAMTYTAQDTLAGALGLDAGAMRDMLRIIRATRRHGWSTRHLGALIYGLDSAGVTRSQLHQRAWTASNHRGTAGNHCIEDLIHAGMMVETQRYHHRGPGLVMPTIWKTTAKGRALVLGAWLKARQSACEPERKAA